MCEIVCVFWWLTLIFNIFPSVIMQIAPTYRAVLEAQLGEILVPARTSFHHDFLDASYACQFVSTD